MTAERRAQCSFVFILTESRTVRIVIMVVIMTTFLWTQALSQDLEAESQI